MGSIPAALPSPDGAYRIHQVSRDYHNAREAVDQAVRNLNSFLLSGSIPPDVDLRKDWAAEPGQPPKDQTG